jgi:anti-sigma factor RsiW
MNCEEARNLIHPLLDGELDARNATELEAHLENCGTCATELANLRGMRNQIASAQLRYRAPESLRRRIESIVPQPKAHVSRREWLKGFGLGASLSAVAASAVFVLVMRNSADNPILSDVVSAHLRSLEPDHLTDVLSSDRHSVKPWFNGRLDVAPPVVDLSAQGFTLIGGRLDAIGGKMVAAIVYKRRAHTINLFIAPRPDKRRPATTESVNGFNIRHWADEGLSLWAISDINAAELEEFSNKFEAAIQKGT